MRQPSTVGSFSQCISNGATQPGNRYVYHLLSCPYPSGTSVLTCSPLKFPRWTSTQASSWVIFLTTSFMRQTIPRNVRVPFSGATALTIYTTQMDVLSSSNRKPNYMDIIQVHIHSIYGMRTDSIACEFHINRKKQDDALKTTH